MAPQGLPLRRQRPHLAGTSPRCRSTACGRTSGDRLLPSVRHRGLQLCPQPRGRLVTVYTNVDRLQPSSCRVPGRRSGRARVLLRRQSLPPHRDPVPRGRWSSSALTTLRSAPASLRALPALLKYGASPCASSRASSPTPSAPQPSTTSCISAAGRAAAHSPAAARLRRPARRRSRCTASSRSHSHEQRFVQLSGQVQYRSRSSAHHCRCHVTGVRLAGSDVSPPSASCQRRRPVHPRCATQRTSGVDALYNSRHLSDQPCSEPQRRPTDVRAVTYRYPRPSVAGQRNPSSGALQALQPTRAARKGAHRLPHPTAADRPACEAEKRRCADLVIAAAERHRPGLAAAVEVVDISTPLTRERYTGNWMGALQARRPDASMIRSLLQGGPRYDHPGLAGFFMAGQWVESWGASRRPRSRDATRYARSARRTACGSPPGARS